MNIDIFYEIVINYLEKMNEIYLMNFFDIFQFCGLLGLFWPSKSLILNQGSKFGQKVH